MFVVRKEKRMKSKEAWIYVYTQLKECPMFCGRYDAKNGNAHFMYGIETVMEHIAWNAGCLEEFTNMFAKNMQESEDDYCSRGAWHLVPHEELIRCKDCKYSTDEYGDGDCYCDLSGIYIGKDWNHFCSWAERKKE